MAETGAQRILFSETFKPEQDTPVLNTILEETYRRLDTSGVPSGVIMAWPATTAPSGFLLCNGSAVSRTTFKNLFATIGTTFGAGDGSTTFNLPSITTSLNSTPAIDDWVIKV